MRIVWFVVLIAIASTSCKPLVYFVNEDKKTKVLNCFHNGEICLSSKLHDVPGLYSLINEDDYLDIYLIHGIRTHTENNYNEFVKSISRELGYNEMLTRGVLSMKGIDSPKLIYSIYQNENTKKYLRYFYVNWSPATQSYKEMITVNYQNNINNQTGIKQAKMNRDLKQTLFHDGFSDITAVLNPDIQKSIFRSFEWVILLSSFHPSVFLEDELKLDAKDIQSNPQKQKVIISGSFGTKLVQEFFRNYILQLNIDDKLMTDAADLTLHGQDQQLVISNLDYIRRDIKSFVKGLDGTQYYWYSLSNQLVLLDAMRLNMYRSGRDTNEQSDLISQRLRSNTNLISFHDPNDILGFHIPGEDHYGNIYAKNVWNIVSPSASKLFFSVANPNKAHLGSRTNNSVISIICYGSDIDN